jgi:hypothetical protein
LLKLLQAKLGAVFFMKVVPAIKLSLGVAAITAITIGAVTQSMPIQDPWFDYVLFIVASAVVSGMPEPDTQLSLPRFIYTWFYRTGHLLVANATAYFIHQQKWSTISSEGVETAGSSSTSHS